jgi:hypothetical protein
LLHDGAILLSFYEEESLRHGLKQFCKRASWPGKPAATFAVNSEKLQELALSLFNSPAGRRILAASRYPNLYDAIWLWLGTGNPQLGERIRGCCNEVKGKLFLNVDLWTALLADIQKEKPDADTVAQLAYTTLAFAMLQEDDRHALGQSFLAVFPEYTEKLLGLLPSGS